MNTKKKKLWYVQRLNLNHRSFNKILLNIDDKYII